MPTLAERRANYDKVSEKIKELGQEGLKEKLAAAEAEAAEKVHKNSFGGTAFKLDLDGVPVFAKRIALTDLEAKNQGSTRNLYELPVHYQYGFGSAGFNAWREVEAHKMTTEWVRNGECPNFPLMYDSIIVDREPQEMLQWLPAFLKDRWNAEEETPIFQRAYDQSHASKSVVVLLESVPQNLSQYLDPQASGREGSSTPSTPNMEAVIQELKSTCDFMASKGMIHFDAHSGNILVDKDGHLLLTDFGLATSRDFDLSEAESKFFDQHQGYDHSESLWGLWHEAKGTISKSEEKISALPEVVTAVEPYQKVGERFNQFVEEFKKNNTTTYPTEEMSGLLRDAESQKVGTLKAEASRQGVLDQLSNRKEGTWAEKIKAERATKSSGHSL